METLQIFKIGGGIIDDKNKLNEFLKALSLVDGKKILIHGGGKIATTMADSLGLKTEMIDGRRITNDQMIDVVTMTYGGLINKQIVSLLQAYDQNAIGLTGADGNLILSKKRPEKNGIDYGWVGDPEKVNVEFLLQLIKSNLLPVIAPLTHDGKGKILNMNADTIASTIAITLSAHFECELNYCFEFKGVMQDISNPDSLIKEITKKNYLQYKEEGIISQGMIPKLDNAFEAINAGVTSVLIMHHEAVIHLKNKEFNEFTIIH